MEKEAVFKKLRFGLERESLIVNAPDEFLRMLEGVDFDSSPKDSTMGHYGYIQVFASSRAEMEDMLKKVEKAGKYDCILWACYPKGSGKLKYDLKRETVWESLAGIGLRPVSQVAIDEKWSALRGRLPELVGK